MTIKLLISTDEAFRAEKYKSANKFFFVAETTNPQFRVYVKVAERRDTAEIKEIDRYFRNNCVKPYYLWYDDVG